jgi:tetratricopeptide (TPR) repeat protein
MAEMITLRAYLDELGAKLEQGSSTAVISHCRYILQHYPQNIEAYRLLGKALLQKGQDEGLTEHFDEAAEVFRRVLSVLPNDYVAHLGMSEVRASEEALDAAIWHLERAYEQMPGNQVLQEALHELYVKRDGEDRAPEKIHLTRSALARQYLSGQLYDQALIELRTALEQDPTRVDLQVLLAETLWNSQHAIEAGEVAVQILKKLPNCLAANRIMARLWLDNERPTDAQLFLDRLEALDPYAAANVVRPHSGVADPNVLPQLDYSAQAQAVLSSETPDWVHELTDQDTARGAESPVQAPRPDRAPSQRSRSTGTGPLVGKQPEPQQPPAWMSDAAAAFPSQEVPDWFAGELSPAPAEAPGASAPADWLSAPLSAEGGLADEETLAPETPDWFVESAGALSESTAQPALQADWLADTGDVPGQGPLPSIDELMGAEPAEQAPIEASWLSDEEPLAPTVSDQAPPELQEQPGTEAGWLAGEAEEVAATDFFAELERLAPTDSAVDVSDERLSSGFTGLLAGIEAAQVPADASDSGADVEPSPPDWLGEFEQEVLLTDETESQPEALASEPQEFETFSTDALEAPEAPPETGEDEAFWTSFDEPAPGWTETSARAEAPEAAPASVGEPEAEAGWPPEDNQAETPSDLGHVAAPEWLPQTRPLTVPAETPLGEDEVVSGGTGDWMSDLRELDNQWLDGEPEVAETPKLDESEAQPQPTALAPEEEGAPEGVGDWMGESAVTPAGEQPETVSEDQIEPASELPDWMREAAPISEPLEEPGAMIPEIPAVDVDLMALFDAQDSGAAAVEDWETTGAIDELPADEPQEATGQDWSQSAPTEDDWLGAFAKFETDQPEGVTHDAALEAQLAGDETLGSVPQDAEKGLSVDGGIGEPGDWLTEVPDLEIETVSAGEPSDVSVSILPVDAIESTLFAEQTTGSDLETPEAAAAEKIEWSSDSEAVWADEAVVSEDQTAAQDDGSPAWLAEVEPIETVGSGQNEELFQQPYDPFEGGSADQVPQYASASQTGILQPDEEPDWITAFSDEEPSIELEEQEPVASGLDLAGLGSFEEGAEAELDTGEEAPVTDSLSRLRFESATPYPANEPEAEDFESDQPAEASDLPNWLLAITNSEADKLGDVFDEPEPYYSSTAEDQGILQPGSEPDWLVEIGDEAEEARVPEPFEVEVTGEEPSGAALEDAGLTPDMFTEELSEVAQPVDLAHTNELGPVTEPIGQPEGDVDVESVPEDFSFGELQPLWLRQPREGDLAEAISGPQEETPDVPEWLRDIFEEDESGE